MKVKVLDVKSMIEKETKNRKEGQLTTHIQNEMAIIYNENGGVLVDYEAIGASFDSLDDIAEISVAPKYKPEVDENGKTISRVSIVATGIMKLPYRELLEACKSKEMEFDEFFSRQNYNPRCISNMNTLYAELNKIGISNFHSKTNKSKKKSVER